MHFVCRWHDNNAEDVIIFLILRGYGLNKLDTSANGIYCFRNLQGLLVEASLYSPRPFRFLNPVDS